MSNQPNHIPDAPPGWFPLSKAFDWFGLSALGPSWHPLFVTEAAKSAAIEGEVDGRRSLDGEVRNGHVIISLTEDEAAEVFIPALCRSFASAVRAGRMRTGFARKGAGAIQDMPVGAWRTDSPRIRFNGWGYDPDNEGASGADLPCWVFVHADGFSALRKELEGWRNALPAGVIHALPVGGGNFLCDTTLGAQWPLPFFLMPGMENLYPGAPLLPDFERPKAAPNKQQRPANDRGSSFAVKRGRKENEGWRRVVREFCKSPNGGKAAHAEHISGPAFFDQVKAWHDARSHQYPNVAVPKDHRATATWRNEWLDEQAGLPR